MLLGHTHGILPRCQQGWERVGGSAHLPISRAFEPKFERLYVPLCRLQPSLGSLESFTNSADCLASLTRV
jgi:hypothetical protein